MTDNAFMLAADGWVQISPLGDFEHAGAGVTQVIDREACDRIAADFIGRKSDANFPGVLVDFDHFSLDTEKSSESAGWMCDLESRDFYRSLHFRKVMIKRQLTFIISRLKGQINSAGTDTSDLILSRPA